MSTRAWNGRAVGLACCLAVAACASGDPRTDGLFGGIHGLTTNAYEQRQQQQLQLLDLTRGAAVASGAEQKQLEGAASRDEAQVAALRRDVQRLQRDTVALRQQVAELRATSGASDARIDAARAKLTQVTAELAEVRRLADADPSATELRARERALGDEIATLRSGLDDIERSR